MGYNKGICIVKWSRPASCYINGKQRQTREYSIWRSMMQRSKENYKLRNRGYEGVSVSERFKNYDFFYDWFVSQVGYSSIDEKGSSFQLDKDMIGDGFVYSEDNCLLLPREINNATIKPRNKVKELPVGVHKKGDRFTVRISRYNKEVGLGTYDTEIEAFNAYKQAKESYLKELAVKWKDYIDPRAYNALMKYEVNIND